MNQLFKDRRFIRFFASRTSANIADSIYSIVLLYFVQQSTQLVAMTSLAVLFLIQDGMIHLVAILVIVFIASCFTTLFFRPTVKCCHNW